MTWILFLLVLLPAGFLAGRYWDSHIAPGLFGQSARKPPAGEFFIGLSRLMDEEGDDSIDTFIKLLEDHADDLESRLALSTLLRRRGKVDQSLGICQKILSSSSLTVQEVSEVKMELARSFISAGLLDRVEKILNELTTPGSAVREQALELAITLYQIEKEWENAIQATRELIVLASNRRSDRRLANLNLMLSHFYCELSLQVSHDQARRFLSAAESARSDNPRITELKLILDASEDNDEAVAKGLTECMQLFPERLSEIFDALSDACPAIAARTGERLLSGAEREHGHDDAVTLFYAGLIQKFRSTEAAADFLRARIEAKGSPALVWQLLSLSVPVAGDIKESRRLQDVALEHASADSEVSRYFCLSCGFEARLHHWQCPGCSKWSTFRPVSQKLIKQQVSL